MTSTERTLARALTRIRKRIRDENGEHFAGAFARVCDCYACYIDRTVTHALFTARRAKRGTKR
jgi:hypothetical protein